MKCKHNNDKMKVRKRSHWFGYILVYNPTHPTCDLNGFIPEHRLVMEKKIGRIIDPKVEVVHHIDRDKTNNNINNLQLLTPIDHVRIHKGWIKVKEKWFKTCSLCENTLEVNCLNFTKRRTGAEFVSNCKKCVVAAVKEWRHRQ